MGLTSQLTLTCDWWSPCICSTWTPQLHPQNSTAQTLNSKWCLSYKMAAFIYRIFWLHFWIVRGSRDGRPFLYTVYRFRCSFTDELQVESKLALSEGTVSFKNIVSYLFLSKDDKQVNATHLLGACVSRAGIEPHSKQLTAKSISTAPGLQLIVMDYIYRTQKTLSMIYSTFNLLLVHSSFLSDRITSRSVEPGYVIGLFYSRHFNEQWLHFKWLS